MSALLLILAISAGIVAMLGIAIATGNWIAAGMNDHECDRPDCDPTCPIGTRGRIVPESFKEPDLADRRP